MQSFEELLKLFTTHKKTITLIVVVLIVLYYWRRGDTSEFRGSPLTGIVVVGAVVAIAVGAAYLIYCRWFPVAHCAKL